MVFASLFVGMADGAEIVSVRAERDDDSSASVVIELTERVRFGVYYKGNEYGIQMRKAEMKGPLKESVFSPLFSVAGVETTSDAKGALTTVKVRVAEGAVAKELVLTDPFRIVLKVEARPGGAVRQGASAPAIPAAPSAARSVPSVPSTQSAAAPVKAAAPPADKPSEAAERPDKEPVRRSVAVVAKVSDTEVDAGKRRPAAAVPASGAVKAKGAANAFMNEIQRKPLLTEYPPHEGWRWVYKRRAIAAMKGDVLEKDRLSERLLAGLVGSSSEGMEEIRARIPERAAELRKGEEPERARLLEGIGALLAGSVTPADFEALIRGNGASDEAMVGRFLLAESLEREGLVAEALGNYARVIRGRSDGAASAALYRKGRLLFYDGKFEEAAKWLAKGAEAAVAGAEVWRANTLYMKGETGEAVSIFAATGVGLSDAFDSVTILTLGEMNLDLGRHGPARDAYAWLMMRHKDDELLKSYLRVRTADALAAEGLVDDAVNQYLRNRDGAKGEGVECASLAYADAVASRADAASHARARQLYEEIAKGSGPGAESALLSLAAMEANLGEFAEAAAAADRFISRYNTSVFKSDATALKGKAAASLVAKLHDKGAHLDAAIAYMRLGPEIPFGRRGEASLKAGKSMLKLSLYDDAARVLAEAARIGRDTPAAEDAYISLAAAHIGRSDPKSAADAVAELKRLFPNSPRMAEVDAVALKVAYLKGDYKAAAAYPADGLDAEAAEMRALSLLRTADYKAAASAFKALAAGNSSAELGLGDSLYMLGTLDGALAAYGRALKDASLSDDDRAWALYRSASIYSRLGRSEDEARALKAMKELKGELTPWSNVIFREPARLKGVSL